MWQKYCWREEGKIIALYNYQDNDVQYFFEFEIVGEVVEGLLFCSKGEWDRRWQKYFREKEMLGIGEMLRIDKILWPDK